MEWLCRCGIKRLLKVWLGFSVGLVFSFTLLVNEMVVQFTNNESKDRFSMTVLEVSNWYNTRTNFCGGHYTGYGHTFFKLKSTVFDPKKNIFTISCNEWMFLHKPSTYWFNGKYAPSRYSKSLTFNKGHDLRNILKDENITVVVYREYPHNFYHAMTQWYNIFVLSKLFSFRMKSVNILLLDTGPVVHIDEQWKLLFQQVIKADELNSPMYFKEAIFNIPGHESPMYYFDLIKLPFIEDFSNHVLQNFGIKGKQSFNCKTLTITLVLRRDYYMHPGVSTEKRIAERKFKNEYELLATLRSEFPGHTVQTLIAEEMSLPEQLSLTSNTDILIGMHGCVLTQILFLPKHAMVLEMYPVFWTVQRFFSSISRWRNIKHEYWQNSDKRNEFANHYTYVPTSVIHEFAQRARKHFACNKHNL
ncbi:EGF domain-specific O-linked N-acetylglucosamine transferase-like [Mercenaria mercenaria]|uniref:EGF domain-specific O-linked N-acetylglucosamine transferase-like n=1 Tax=Mercenaria mercenaria TaxID=6596 RepID=UPI001E1D7091|nr:EGF domain-specific O-linked N-acetylglucosamine transferase-like [Mercenaria mercenaria]